MAPEFGDTINGSKLGRAATSTYYWVDCPEKVSPDCLGPRWATVLNGRYSPKSSSTVRLCLKCRNYKAMGWTLGPKKLHARGFD